MGFFSQDSTFSRAGTILFDLLILNLLVSFGSIITLGIGFGALVTAMFYSIHKTFFEKEGYVFQNFKKSLKVNFVQATVVWLILLLTGLISYMAGSFSIQIGGIVRYFAAAHFLIFMQVMFVSMYAFPLLSLVDIKTKALLSQSFLIANKHLLSSLSVAFVVLLGLFMSFYIHGVFMLLLISGSGYIIYSLLVKRVLIRYFDDDQKKQLFNDFEQEDNLKNRKHKS